MQETLQRSMQERFRALEQQLALEQQRQRDHLEEEVRKVRQLFSVTEREQQQHQQTTLAAFRETIEQMRREFSAALQHLSEDVAHTLRQAEEQNRRTVANLRAEILQLLLEHDPASIKRQLLGGYPHTPEKPLPSSTEEYRP
jgi:phosphate uptake regulator